MNEQLWAKLNQKAISEYYHSNINLSCPPSDIISFNFNPNFLFKSADRVPLNQPPLNNLSARSLIPLHLAGKYSLFPTCQGQAATITEQVRSRNKALDTNVITQRIVKLQMLSEKDCALLFLEHKSMDALIVALGLAPYTKDQLKTAQPHLDDTKIIASIDRMIVELKTKPLDILNENPVSNQQNITNFFYNLRLKLDYHVMHAKVRPLTDKANETFLSTADKLLLTEIFKEYTPADIMAQLAMATLDAERLSLDSFLTQKEVELLDQSRLLTFGGNSF